MHSFETSELPVEESTSSEVDTDSLSRLDFSQALSLVKENYELTSFIFSKKTCQSSTFPLLAITLVFLATFSVFKTNSVQL
jgi:hypothetical protein